MAGTLEVTEDLCWMPAGWVFDNVLERIADVPYPQDSALAELLLASRTDANGGYLDLRDVNPGSLQHATHGSAGSHGEEGSGPLNWAALPTQSQGATSEKHRGTHAGDAAP